MAKSGKRRQKRLRAKQRAEANGPLNGEGPDAHLKYGYKARLEQMAISRGWIDRGESRFPTRENRGDIIRGIEAKGDINLIERLTLSAFDGMDAVEEDGKPNHRRRGIAERLVLAMELANQRDDQTPSNPTPQQHLHLHQNGSPDVAGHVSSGVRSGDSEPARVTAERSRLVGLVAEARRRIAANTGIQGQPGTAAAETVGDGSGDQPA